MNAVGEQQPDGIPATPDDPMPTCHAYQHGDGRREAGGGEEHPRQRDGKKR